MQNGDVVKINYVGRLEDGEIFDLTYEEVAKKEKVYSPKIKYKPVPIIVGAGFVIPGVDNAIKGMNVHDKKSITVEPKDAFGERDPKLIHVVPQTTFKDQKVEPRQGMIVDFSGMKGRIQSVTGGRVRVDFNNPLAGKTLKYDIEIVEKINDTVDKIKAAFEFFGLTNLDVSIQSKEAFVKGIVPPELKRKISTVILENIHELDKLTFQETFEKKTKE